MKCSTTDLTTRIASGDPVALAVFYEQWFDHIYREAQRLTRRDEQECLDVVQDVMLRVVKSIKPMDSEARVAGWLRTVVRSCVYDRFRAEEARLRRQRARAHRDAPARHESIDSDQLDWLRSEIDSLEEHLRRPLLLRIINGFTLAQIGGLLGLTPGAVDGRVNRAMNTLRRRAKEHDDE